LSMHKHFYTIIALIFILLAPVQIYAAIRVPNDKFYKEQEAYFSQINLQKAWVKTTGSSNVIIAIIDSGVDTDHPDILQNMWFNKGEKPLNGIDDDSNGYVDDLNGWDFLSETSDPHPKFDEIMHDFEAISHGTVVSGVAASVTDNYEGLAGVCWNCKIMALRALDSDGSGTTVNISRAIDYAVANGADIINMSFVGHQTDSILSDAINRAYDTGVVLVAAVGNDGENEYKEGGDLDIHPVYPVCSDGDASENRVLGVGSVEFDNTKSSFSNYGLNCIDINAPGSNLAAPQIYDPSQGELFESKYRKGWSGTSVSVPIVSGVAGLMKSINQKLSNKEVISIISNTGVSVDAENPLYAGRLGAGLLDALAAVEQASEAEGSVSGVRAALISSKGASKILITSGKNHIVESIISDSHSNFQSQWQVYPEFFRGGAELASGDVNGDGIKEIISGAGGGGGPQVRVFTQTGQVLGQFFAYDSSFRGGVHVATADFDKDGIDEIVASAGAGLSSEVRIFNMKGEIKWSFSVTAKGLEGGITVTAGDIDKDGEIEIITGTGGGSLPMVQIFDKLGNKEGSFLAYPTFFKGGVNVAVGDVDADGAMEIVTAAGNGGGPQVRVFGFDGTVKGQFFAYENTFRGGARVAVGNIDKDAQSEIIVGSGIGRVSEVRVFSKYGAEYTQDTMFPVFEEGYEGGVHVGI